MPCSCSETWATSKIARERGLTWKIASKQDAPAIKAFVDAGGCGRSTIDTFAREDLIRHAGFRYSNTHLLIEGEKLVAFTTNAMGMVALTDQEAFGMNMEPFSSEVPTLFLHRLGVLHTHQRRGLSILLGYRLFESLKHVCAHTAAACVALYVDPDNDAAKALYRDRFFFQSIRTDDRRHELMAIGYAEAIEQLSLFEKSVGP